MRMGGAAATAAAALLTLPSATLPQEQPVAAIDTHRSGMICLAAIYVAVEEIASRCDTDLDVGQVEALRRSIAKMDNHLIVHGWTDENLSAFKTQMSNAEATDDQMCSGDGLEFANAMSRAPAEQIEAQADAMIAMPGPPPWGTCL